MVLNGYTHHRVLNKIFWQKNEFFTRLFKRLSMVKIMLKNIKVFDIESF